MARKPAETKKEPRPGGRCPACHAAALEHYGHLSLALVCQRCGLTRPMPWRDFGRLLKRLLKRAEQMNEYLD